MTRDDHLTISCPCGAKEVVVINGYASMDIEEAKGIGLEARSLCPKCRRKRFIRIGYFALTILVTAAILAVGAVWWSGAREVVKAEHRLTAEHHLMRGFSYYQAGEYDKAIEECDEALKLEPNNEAAKSNRALALKFKNR